jgi:hypothetical protein
MAAILDLGFRQLSDKHLGLLVRFFVGGEWRKVPFVDQRHRSFKMAGMATILDLVSVEGSFR